MTETSTSHLTSQCPNVKVIVQYVKDHDPVNKVVCTHSVHACTDAHTHRHTHYSSLSDVGSTIS